MPSNTDIRSLDISESERLHADLVDMDCYTNPLTPQERQFVIYHVRGNKPSVAARMAGYSGSHANALLNKPSVQEAIAVMRDQINHEMTVAITQDNLNAMLLEAHRKAATATEEVAAVRELAKLNEIGGYSREKRKIEVNINSYKQFENMTDAELLNFAHMGIESLSPDGAIDGEFEEVGE